MSSSESLPEANTVPSFTRRNYSPSTRFLVCLLVLVTQGIGQIVIVRCYKTQQSVLCFIAQLFITFLGAFAMQWCQIYSSGLTRAKHAFFDEFNVLKTYQPRARTMGHLFMPEPPTPVPDSQRQQQDAKKAAERNAFLQMRDAHYANEYAYVEKVNREIGSGKHELQPGHRPIVDPGNPKIEGPVLIEFHADSEKDDEDYSI